MQTVTEDLFEIEEINIKDLRVKKKIPQEVFDKIRRTYDTLQVGQGFSVPKTLISNVRIKLIFESECDHKLIKFQPIGSKTYDANYTATRIICVKKKEE
jgi:hypothetical protein